MNITIKKTDSDEKKLLIFYRMLNGLLNGKSKEQLIAMIIKRMTISEIVEYINSNINTTTNEKEIFYIIDKVK